MSSTKNKKTFVVLVYGHAYIIMVILRSQIQITDFFMILDLGMSLYSWPTIYDAGPALNEHSASSTQSPDFMRLSLRVRLRRVGEEGEKWAGGRTGPPPLSLKIVTGGFPPLVT